eukprot:scaffold4380_cov161-Skeletonema_marinoi.AAC.1
MVPYSLSACQVVRVFCAVMRALGASPIMVSDCKVALQCYVILSSLSLLLNWLSVLAPRPLFGFARHPRRFSKIFWSFSELSSHTKQPCCDGMFRGLKGNHWELISGQHVYLDPIATAQRVICGDFNVSS